MENVNNQIDAVDEMSGKYLSFYVDNELYCIELSYISIIKQMLPITTVPDLPHYIKGIINLRDEIIIPIVDMRARLNKMPEDYNERTCIIVIMVQGLMLGLIVDTVSEVVQFEPKNIIAPPSARSGFSNKFIKNLGKLNDTLYLILDCDKLFSSDDFSLFDGLSENI